MSFIDTDHRFIPASSSRTSLIGLSVLNKAFILFFFYCFFSVEGSTSFPGFSPTRRAVPGDRRENLGTRL